jgi:hypothetical protein
MLKFAINAIASLAPGHQAALFTKLRIFAAESPESGRSNATGSPSGIALGRSDNAKQKFPPHAGSGTGQVNDLHDR